MKLQTIINRILPSSCKLILVTLFITTSISAQTNKTFFLGHSLINFEIPNMVDKLSIANSSTFSYDACIGNGANLFWQYTYPTTAQGSQWNITLPQGGFENFILTEAVPLQNHLLFSNTYRYADSLCAYANQYNPEIQFYIYETWHCTFSGNGSTSGEGGYPCSWDTESNTPWRERIDIDLPKWESIADSINLIYDNPMQVIPGGQALGRLSDSIEIGAVLGLNSILDLFNDEYHVDSRGNYFIACVMFSVIHGTSPVGLPNRLTDRFGGLYNVYPTPEQALKMQEIAWETVCNYQRDGVDCGIVDVEIHKVDEQNIKIFPVPASDFIHVEITNLTKEVPYKIYNQLGENITSGKINSVTTTINTSQYSAGIYFLTINNQQVKFLITQ